MSELMGRPIVVMGVQGSGKSTIGVLLAQKLGFIFVDGDDLHSPEAKAKMAGGNPLNDQDRAPWLDRIGDTINEHAGHGRTLVVACSALKKTYRNRLRSTTPELVFVHLEGQQGLVAERLSHRNHEYMPPTLLDSQFETLEPLSEDEAGFAVDVTQAPNEVVEQISSQLGQ